MIVVELVAATAGGALLGAAGMYVWVRWVARPKPLLVRHRRVSGQEFRRLASTFDLRGPDDRIEAPPVHTLGGERGSSADDRARYTYVRGPVRGRDHE